MYPENPNYQQPQIAPVYNNNNYNYNYPEQKDIYQNAINDNRNQNRNSPHQMHQIYIINDTQYPRLANGYPEPVTIKCPTCNRVCTTNTRHRPGGGTWACCLILGLTVGCCCIPFFMKSCQNAEHFCSNCGASVGHYEYTIL